MFVFRISDQQRHKNTACQLPEKRSLKFSVGKRYFNTKVQMIKREEVYG